jgi:hypothetical protein
MAATAGSLDSVELSPTKWDIPVSFAVHLVPADHVTSAVIATALKYSHCSSCTLVEHFTFFSIQNTQAQACLTDYSLVTF